MNTFLHPGKLGDLIYSLPAVRTIGEATIYIGGTDPNCLKPNQVAPLLPLLEIQPYVEKAAAWQGEEIDHDLGRFFAYTRDKARNLADCHLMTVGATGKPPFPDRNRPWLTVDAVSDEMHGRVIFARSARYRGVPGFWERCWQVFKDRAVFVGTAEEHAEFCKRIGPIPYRTTKDLLELARLIAGADLFVGNQSAPYAIAEGLKRPTIQEVCLMCPNCVFERPDALYVYDEPHLDLIGGFAKTLDSSQFEIDLSARAIRRVLELGIEPNDPRMRQGRPLNFGELISGLSPIHREDRIRQHQPSERAHRFSSFNADVAEIEVLNFLNALVYLFKPVHLLETGTGSGLSAIALASALVANGTGFLRTVELDRAVSEYAQGYIARATPGLSSAISFNVGDSLTFINQWAGAPFDFVFLDSPPDLRQAEFQLLRERGLLADDAVCVFHDTSRVKDGIEPNLIDSGRQWLELGLSRGLRVIKMS